MTWASSRFFTTAVLAWERKDAREREKQIARAEQNSVSSNDFRDMRARRMQGSGASEDERS